jgi:hypothetical protein
MSFADGSIVFHTSSWQQGWIAEEVDDHWEVYYTPTERMRIGADGSLQFGGQPEYIFQTREWAQLCAERLNSLDTAFGRGPHTMRLSMTGGIGIGTTSPSVMFEIRTSPGKPVISIAEGGHLTHFDLPYFVMGWWRSTRAYAAWRVLMWGENA